MILNMFLHNVYDDFFVNELEIITILKFVSAFVVKFSKKNPGLRLMEKMGYQIGKGLGRNLDGRLRPIETLGRCGLKWEGFGWKPINYELASEPDRFTNVNWLENKHENLPDIEKIQDWESKRFVDETNDRLIGTVFCDDKEIVLDSMRLSKKLIKHKSRSKHDPKNKYEIKHATDIKLGNIDIVYDHMFTYPNVAQGQEILYFVDISSGSQRLCDYILTKLVSNVRGFGFINESYGKDSQEDVKIISHHVFTKFHGIDFKGNLCNLKNQLPMVETIITETKGVHCVTCAGENLNKGQDYNDEMTTKQLYLCQLYLALKVLRIGGNFVMRTGNLFTIFSASLIYLLYRCFDRISIFKPKTSDLDDVEKFVICQGKRANTENVESYLERVNNNVLQKGTTKDLLSLVSFDDLVSDHDFREYLRKQNEKIGMKEVDHMKITAAFIKDDDDDVVNKCVKMEDDDDDEIEITYDSYDGVCMKKENIDDDEIEITYDNLHVKQECNDDVIYVE